MKRGILFSALALCSTMNFANAQGLPPRNGASAPQAGLETVKEPASGLPDEMFEVCYLYYVVGPAEGQRDITYLVVGFRIDGSMRNWTCVEESRDEGSCAEQARLSCQVVVEAPNDQPGQVAPPAPAAPLDNSRPSLNRLLQELNR